MIIVQLIGGLGNQMFQYALGRSLADRLHVALKLDITPFRSYKLRQYALWALNIREDLATDREVAQARARQRTTTFRRLRRALVPGERRTGRFVKEQGFAFDSAALDTPDGSYLEGYWQSEKYFSESRERLRVEFSVRSPISGVDAAIAERMKDGASVSLHVRRGDYTSNPNTARIFDVCDAAYFSRCIDYIADTVEDPRFFVFSDEPHWAAENLSIPFPTTVVGHNTAARNYEDLRLMSLCRHHVIANSSFSWWGAWLGADPSKVVLLPKRWFLDLDPEYTADIRPPGWIAL